MRQSKISKALLTLSFLVTLPITSQGAEQNSRSLISSNDSKRFASDFVKPYTVTDSRFSSRQSITNTRINLNRQESVKPPVVPTQATVPTKKETVKKQTAPSRREVSKRPEVPKKETPKEEKPVETPKKVAAMSASSSGSSNPQATGFASNVAATKVNVEPFAGSASTGIPIEVPPGRAGIQPNLALTYSSSAGNGMFGVGWNMEIGAIERSTKKGVPTYDDSKDLFVLMMGGSQELVYDPATKRYYSEVEGAFNKIERAGDNWVMTDKKGTRYLFGGNEDSRVVSNDARKVFRWNLNRVEDLQGNTMTISYVSDNGQVYPSEILYTSNTRFDIPAHGRVEFVRGRMFDKEATTSYRSGFKVRTEMRINKINIYADGKKEREYRISYGQSNDTARGIIKSVTLYSGDETKSQPPVTFDYSQVGHTDNKYFQRVGGWQIPSELQFIIENPDPQSNSTTPWLDNGVRSMDVNGDGFMDFIKTARSCQGETGIWQVYLNNKKDGWELDTNRVKETLPLSINRCDTSDDTERVFYKKINEDRGVRFEDINGDGLTDIIQASDDVAGRLSKVYINKNNQFVEKLDIKIPDQVSFNKQIIETDNSSRKVVTRKSEGQNTTLADVNGDGFVDIVTGGAEPRLYLNKKGKDANALGWEEQIPSNVPNVGNFSNGLVMVDLNGDSLPDMFKAIASRDSEVYFNTGNGFIQDTSNAWTPPNQLVDMRYNSTLADANGDGLPDLIYYAPDKTSVYINTGNGWLLNPNWSMPGADFLSGGTRFLDVNKDGLTDYIHYASSTPQVYLNLGREVKQSSYTSDASGPSDLLVSIGNGIGGKTKITYKSSLEYNNKHLPFALQTVDTVTTSNNRGDSYTVRYSYEGGLWDANYREFAGFEKVRIIDPDGNYSVTTYDHRHYYKGRALIQESYNSEGRLLSKSVNQWGEQDITQTTPQVKFIMLKRTDNYTYDYPAAGRRTAQVMIYDQSPQYGDATRVINYGEVNLATGEDLKADDTTLNITSFIHNTEKWLMSIPNETVVNDINNGMLAGTVFYYDGSDSHMSTPSNGLLTKKRIQVVALGDGSSLGDVITKYEYDNIGNIIKTTDPKGNSTTVEYDSKYRMFPTKVTNAIGQSSSSVYYGINPLGEEGLYKGLWGQLKSTTDANGQISKTIYDAFGRSTKVIGPLDSAENPTAQTIYQEFSDYIKVSSKVLADRATGKTIDSVAFYDGLGRLIQQKSRSAKAGQYIVGGQVQYNNRGLVWKSFPSYFTTNDLNTIDPINPSAPYSEAQYDAQGRVKKAINPNGDYSTVLYDEFNVETIDENGHKSRSQYDVFGRLIMKIEYTGADGRNRHYPQSSYEEYARTHYKYDIKGNLIEVKDAKGNTTTIGYDSLGRKISMNDPDMGYWQYGYDGNGNLAWQRDAKGKLVTFAYDKLNRLLNKNDTGLWAKREDSKAPGLGLPLELTPQPASVNPPPRPTVPAIGAQPTSAFRGDESMFNVDYGYDDANMGFANGRLTQAQYGSDYAKFYYDQLGRETKSLKKVDDRVYKVERQYDTLNRLTDLQYPDDSHVYYSYNDVGQIQSVSRNRISSVPQATKEKPFVHYKFNETRGSFIIDSGTAETYAAVVNEEKVPAYIGQAEINNTDKKFGAGSLVLNGSSAYVTVPDSNNLALGQGDFTIDGWFKNAALGTNQAILSQNDATQSNRIQLFLLASNKLRFLVQKESVNHAFYVTKNASITDTNWHHIACVRKGSDFKIYVDGVAQELEVTTAIADNSVPNFPSPLYVGADTVTGFYYSGLIDELRLSKGIARWTANFTPSTAVLADEYTQLLLHFDTQSQSSSGNPIAISSQQGKINKAISFIEGDAKLVNIDDLLAKVKNDTRGAFAFWVKPTALNQKLLSFKSRNADEPHHSFSLGITSGKIQVNFWGYNPNLNRNDDINEILTKNPILNKDTWAHIALIQDGTELAIYVNGIKQEIEYSNYPSPVKSAWFASVPQLNTGYIAGYYQKGITQNNFIGQIDDFRYYRRSLENLEIQAIYKSGQGTEAGDVLSETPTDNNDYIVKSLDYNAQGQTTKIEYGNGVITQYAYDPKNLRLTQYMTYSAAGDLVQYFQYKYDGIGQIVEIVDHAHTASQTFQYDSLNRLIFAQGSYGLKTYRYDQIGNILEKDGLSYTYGELQGNGRRAGPHAVTSLSDGTRFEYDENGNMSIMIEPLKRNKLTHYVYDGENRLRQVKVLDSVNTLRRTLSSYFYDGDGGRVKKLVYKNNKTSDLNAPVPASTGGRRGMPLMIAEPIQDSPKLRVYTSQASCMRGAGDCDTSVRTTYSMDLPSAPATPVSADVEVTRFVGNIYEEVGDRKTKFVYLGSTRVASVSGNDTMYYHTDHLGSTNVLTDKTGMVRQLVEYEPFGQIVKQEKYGDDFSTAWYYFTGKPVDDETGLMYYGARYYNPKLGRFITPDTIIPNPARPQSLNRYSYCENNPVNFTDPTGHKKKSWFKKAWNYFTSNTIVGGFIQAVQSGNWAQFGRQLAVMAISAAATLLLPGSGTLASNLFMNVGLHAVRGAAIGAVTGGLSSVIMGGTFADGARVGAIAGGITGAIQGVRSSEQFSNWRGGNGFKSNADVRAIQERSSHIVANMQESLDRNNLIMRINTSEISPGQKAILMGKVQINVVLMGGGFEGNVLQPLTVKQVDWSLILKGSWHVGSGAVTTVVGAYYAVPSGGRSTILIGYGIGRMLGGASDMASGLTNTQSYSSQMSNGLASLRKDGLDLADIFVHVATWDPIP